MLAMSGRRAFSLAAEPASGAVSCGVNGVFVGDAPLLRAAGRAGAGAKRQWSVRPISELNEDLSAQYGLPVDVAAKANALALIAAAFNRGDLAMAAIATVQMQFPDPPLTKGRETEVDLARSALELHRSRLLKVWEPDEHPRTGAPPNPGWFAPVPKESPQPIEVAADTIHPCSLQPFETGGGGGGGVPNDSEPELPFPGGLPRMLPEYVPGGKTYGVFETPQGRVMLQSGYEGPAQSMPPGSAGFDRYTLSHVEGHAAAMMRQEGISEATLYINNPKICDNCSELLESMLPHGAKLHIVLPDGTTQTFVGIGP